MKFGCGNTQHPILAVGRTGGSPARLTYGPNPSTSLFRRVCDMARYSATQPPRGQTLVTEATAAFGSGGVKTTGSNAATFADATEALMSRLPLGTVNRPSPSRIPTDQSLDAYERPLCARSGHSKNGPAVEQSQPAIETSDPLILKGARCSVA